MVDKILLHGARFYGRHGVTAEEQSVGGRYVVDVEVTRDLTHAASSDSLADTTSYSEVYRAVREIVEGESFHLLEALAERVAQTLLTRFGAKSVWVRVTKQPPPLDGIVDAAGVEIVRARE